MEGTHWDCGSGWSRLAPWVCEPRARGGQAAAPAAMWRRSIPQPRQGAGDRLRQRNFRERWTHSLEVSCIKCKALIGKEWASGTWEGPPEEMFVGTSTLRPCTPEPAGGPLARWRRVTPPPQLLRTTQSYNHSRRDTALARSSPAPPALLVTCTPRNCTGAQPAGKEGVTQRTGRTGLGGAWGWGYVAGQGRVCPSKAWV